MMASVAGITLVVSDLPWLSHLVLAIDSAFLVILMLLIIPPCSVLFCIIDDGWLVFFYE
ncbi:hypothetical protein ARALYDRAFT_887515 [Arabidopsis lyrata subsp. lyrata]|uniref:Transmembrane protein n=2 Tax=Arabidopsis lyrata subsp. lyrata TaxID=81972 RepID=D7KCG9_ARALL|nr:hypothetical protein ARALYDRAFT_887515 [Arabidopsis lyrata subsp. lyrata]